MSEIQRLARTLQRLEDAIKGLSTSPQLAYSSIEGGAINGYTDDGTHTTTVGTQVDGSGGAYATNGPTPPTPSAPILTSIEGGLLVHWDGEFADGALITMDFSRVEIHASATSGFDPITSATLRGTIESPRGGDFVILGPPTWTYVKFVARSLPGKSSVPSAESKGRPYVLTFKRERWTPTYPVGTLDLSYVPLPDSLHLFVNGVQADEGVDYTLSGFTLTLTSGLVDSGDIVWARYAFHLGGDGLTAVPTTSPQSAFGMLGSNTGFGFTATTEDASGILNSNTGLAFIGNGDVGTGQLNNDTT